MRAHMCWAEWYALCALRAPLLLALTTIEHIIDPTKDTLEQKRKENKKLVVTRPRGATADWCHDIVKLWNSISTEGIWVFHQQPILEGAKVLEAVRTGKKVHESVWQNFLKLRLPAAMGIAADQEQKQITGTTALQRLRLMIELISDPTHRSQRNWLLSLADAGQMTAFYAALHVLNIAYGPYATAMWFHLLVQSGQDLARSMLPDDVFLQKAWPMILVDKGMQHTPGTNTKPMRKSYIEKTFAHQTGCSILGVKAAPSSWGQWHRAFKAADPELHSRGVLIAKTCLHRGDVVCAEDLFTPIKSLPARVLERKASSLAAAKRAAKQKISGLIEKSKKCFSGFCAHHLR